MCSDMNSVYLGAKQIRLSEQALSQHSMKNHLSTQDKLTMAISGMSVEVDQRIIPISKI